MVFGALIIGVGIGLAAMVTAIAAGASVFSAFLAYWLVSCAGTVGICVVKALYCRAGTAQTPSTNQSG